MKTALKAAVPGILAGVILFVAYLGYTMLKAKYDASQLAKQQAATIAASNAVSAAAAEEDGQ